MRTLQVCTFVLATLAMGIRARDAYAQFAKFEDAQFTTSGTNGDGFGSAMAVQGSRLFVGANSADTVATDAGEVQLFQAGSPPTFVGTLHGSDLAASDGFGSAIAVDGDRLAVSAPNHAAAGARSGAVYLFTWNGSAWIQEAKLWPSDGADGDGFGSSVALDGDTLVVGAPGWDAPGNPSEGAAYVFTRSVGGWSFTQKLTTTDHDIAEGFGKTVAVDGERLAVSTVYGNGGYPTGGTGSVFTYQRNGGTWQQDGRLVPPAFAGVYGTYGDGLDIQGDVLAVGQPYGTAPSGTAGVVHVYRFALGAWASEASLESNATYGSSPLLGLGIALEGDRLIAGCTWYSSYGFASGGVFCFRRVSATWTDARLEHVLVPSNGQQSGFFGQSLASDGVRVLARESGAFARPIVWSFDLLTPVGSEFCFGDGAGTPCPCGNDTNPAARMGCANDTVPRGATLRAAGSTSVAADDLECSILGIGGGPKAMILFAGTTRINGGAGVVFGDGLRCVGGAVRRFGVMYGLSNFGIAVYGPSLRAAGGWNAGDTRYFQAHYRSNNGPCGLGFNFTNAVEVTFTP